MIVNFFRNMMDRSNKFPKKLKMKIIASNDRKLPFQLNQFYRRGLYESYQIHHHWCAPHISSTLELTPKIYIFFRQKSQLCNTFFQRWNKNYIPNLNGLNSFKPFGHSFTLMKMNGRMKQEKMKRTIWNAILIPTHGSSFVYNSLS